MKNWLIFTAFLLAAVKTYGQFSLGADLVSIGLSSSAQHEIGLMPDTGLSRSRIVLSVNSSLAAAYKHKNWEFSFGIGHGYYFWKQKFDAPTTEVKEFLGANVLSDSSDYLAKVTYSSNFVTLPVGAKYLFGNHQDKRFNAFLSLKLMPAFAYRREASAGFFRHPDFFLFPFPVSVEEDPMVEAAAKSYFEGKMNPFILDGRLETGFRIWGRKHRYAVDLSAGYLYGFVPLHEQMGHTNGIFGNLALRFFLKSK